jgi:hypothetical protein
MKAHVVYYQINGQIKLGKFPMNVKMQKVFHLSFSKNIVLITIYDKQH